MNRITRMYASYDRIAELHGHLFPAESDSVAIRAFSNALRSEVRSDMSENPQHFELFYLGDYDYSAGVLIPSDIKRRKPIVTGDQIMNSPKVA